MEIKLKCFASLADSHDCSYHDTTELKLEQGATVKQAMSASGVPEKDVKVIFVNGRSSTPGQVLEDNDSVTLVPATGGM